MPSTDRKGKNKAMDNGEQDFLALDIDGDRGESGRGGEGYQQMQLVEQQVSPRPYLHYADSEDVGGGVDENIRVEDL